MNLARLLTSVIAPSHDDAPLSRTPQEWHRPFDRLRQKWNTVPATYMERRTTSELLTLSDEDLLATWQTAYEDGSTGPHFSHRGWFHVLYADTLRGKKVLDVGSGFGISSLTFAREGAHVTFLDVHEDNLAVLQRLARLMGITSARFVHLQDLASLTTLDAAYDVILALGSLHHAPQTVIKPEVQELLRHLRVGGRWLQLAYPKARWEREGRLPFNRWGEVTDGEGTPWAEWYDVPKLAQVMAPARCEVVLYREFDHGSFNWFDLLYQGGIDAGVVVTDAAS